MPELQQSRAIATREKILRGGAEVFSKKGYEGTTVADILVASEVTKGAMYFHFPSKEHLGRAIVTIQTDVIDSFEVSNGQPAAQHLIDVSFRFAKALLTDPLMRASVRMATEGHGFDQEQHHTFETWLHLGSDLAQKAIIEGDIRSTWTALQVAETLTAAVNGAQQSSLIFSQYADLVERLCALWKMLAPGLFTPKGMKTLRLHP